MSEPEAKRRELSAAWLTQAYLVQRLTAEQIAAASGWSSQYVRDQLRDHGIGLRSPGPHSGLRTIDRDLLSGWLAEGTSIAAIADRSGYSTTGIRKLLKRWALNVPPTPQPVATGNQWTRTAPKVAGPRQRSSPRPNPEQARPGWTADGSTARPSP